MAGHATVGDRALQSLLQTVSLRGEGQKNQYWKQRGTETKHQLPKPERKRHPKEERANPRKEKKKQKIREAANHKVLGVLRVSGRLQLGGQDLNLRWIKGEVGGAKRERSSTREEVGSPRVYKNFQKRTQKKTDCLLVNR